MSEYGDSSSSSDWSYVRTQRLRWDFVNALVRAADSHRRGSRLGCTKDRCCAPLTEMYPSVGLALHWRADGSTSLDFAAEFRETVTETMRDGMSMISTYAEHQTGHPLDGYMEVPFAIGDVIHSRYFTRGHHDRSGDAHVSHEPSDERRELLYAFACVALPDEHLDVVRRGSSGEDGAVEAFAEMPDRSVDDSHVAPVS